MLRQKEWNTGGWRWKVAQAAEIRWWQRYLRRRPKADYLQWKRQYWQQLLTDINLQIPPSAHVLDAGCGPAGLFIILPTQTVDALDPLLDAYQTQLSHFNPKDYPNVQFLPQALETLHHPNHYDYVFCLNAINHVDQLDRCLDRLVQSLRPNGQLILSIDAHNHQFLKHLFRLLPGDILHPHQYDLAEYQAFLHQRGLQLQQNLRYRSAFIFDYHILVARKVED